MSDCAVHGRAKNLLKDLLDLDYGISLPLEDPSNDENHRMDLAMGRVWIRAAMFTLEGVLDSVCDTPADDAFMEFLDDVERQGAAMRKAMMA